MKKAVLGKQQPKPGRLKLHLHRHNCKPRGLCGPKSDGELESKPPQDKPKFR